MYDSNNIYLKMCAHKAVMKFVTAKVPLFIYLFPGVLTFCW